MEITIVTNKWERDEYRKVIDAYGHRSIDMWTAMSSKLKSVEGR